MKKIDKLIEWMEQEWTDVSKDSYLKAERIIIKAKQISREEKSLDDLKNHVRAFVEGVPTQEEPTEKTPVDWLFDRMEEINRYVDKDSHKAYRKAKKIEQEYVKKRIKEARPQKIIQ